MTHLMKVKRIKNKENGKQQEEKENKEKQTNGKKQKNMKFTQIILERKKNKNKKNKKNKKSIGKKEGGKERNIGERGNKGRSRGERGNRGRSRGEKKEENRKKCKEFKKPFIFQDDDKPYTKKRLPDDRWPDGEPKKRYNFIYDEKICIQAASLVPYIQRSQIHFLLIEILKNDHRQIQTIGGRVEEEDCSWKDTVFCKFYEETGNEFHFQINSTRNTKIYCEESRHLFWFFEVPDEKQNWFLGQPKLDKYRIPLRMIWAESDQIDQEFDGSSIQNYVKTSLKFFIEHHQSLENEKGKSKEKE